MMTLLRALGVLCVLGAMISLCVVIFTAGVYAERSRVRTRLRRLRVRQPDGTLDSVTLVVAEEFLDLDLDPLDRRFWSARGDER